MANGKTRRLVVELPEDTYLLLDELQRMTGKFKWKLVDEMVLQKYRNLSKRERQRQALKAAATANREVTQ